MSKTNTKQKRTVTVLVRYLIKQDAFAKEINSYVKAGTIILLVQNDKGDRYYVTLRRDGAHACTCPHAPFSKTYTCYHITHCRDIENKRAATLAAQRVEQELDAIVAQAEQEAEQERKHTKSSPTDLGDRGQLNRPRAFSMNR
jgi:hypothetical protein